MVRWLKCDVLVFSASHLVKVTLIMRYCLCCLVPIFCVTFTMSASSLSTPSQVGSHSSQTNQILQLPWKQEIALLIASHSPLLLPPTNHMVINLLI